MTMKFAGFAIFAMIFSAKANRETKLQNWSSWIRCDSVNESCQWKRRRACIDQEHPHLTCGEEEGWLEKYRSCISCEAPGTWYFMSATSCEGSGCTGKRQDVTYGCTDHLGQPNCEKTVTKFCDLSRTCDGNWGSWEVTHPCSAIPTNIGKVEIKSRTCYKNFTRSTNCNKDDYDFTDVQRKRCVAKTATTSTASATARSTIITSATITPIFDDTNGPKQAQENNPLKEKQSGKKLQLSPTNESAFDSNQEPNVRSGSCFWWNEKSYILIIQSIIILFLIGVIIYLLRLRSKMKRTNQAVAASELPVLRSPMVAHARSPSLSYNRLSSTINVFDPPESNSEYAHMLPNHRLSLPNFQRPLPRSPSLEERPSKPPRLHRAALQRQTLPKPTPTQNGTFLNAPIASLHLAHSAPTSPKNDQPNLPNLYSSIDNLYLKPINY